MFLALTGPKAVSTRTRELDAVQSSVLKPSKGLPKEGEGVVITLTPLAPPCIVF